jgi:hypothetical protein
MLREISTSRQNSGEAKRRWFTSSNIDLFIWVNDQDAPTAFQLCYDKQHREHALTWTEATGFSHMAVDGGESRPARYKGAPILVADGKIDARQILDDFLREAKSLPAEFVQLVETRVRELVGEG